MQLLLPFLFLCTTISIILGAIAWARTTTLYLPLPISLSATTTILPILTPILLFLARFLSNQSTTGANTPTFRNRFITSVISYLLTILPSGLATLALTYLFAPDLLVCQLNNQWQSYYHNKDSRAIRAIQDSLHCCGFRSVKDRAWPFKDRTHDDDACVEQIGYARACLGPWEQEDKGAAWMVLWAAVLILVVKIASSQLNRSPGWMGRANTNRFIRISGAEDQEEGEEHANANGNVGDDRPTHQLPQPGQSTHDDVWSR
ncbi:hypothetical protein F9C07_2246783 [Aspergillus flavus]|uniref:Tetraspanin Tsp3 n=2 Tax=Aspergillus subgen. Circumdati TaxID=2720871 RepID=A0A7G5KEQ9_ASPFN|nr:uncharacterized protein G4B84_009764 [Aspergillus flavus NRRL3357]OOO09085.1 Tetraspanin [Aspergillus oryzae]QMW46351.1 hypothetical protein G4B11_009806 [Aspergillus flavus]QMW34298.1 hypothetical protein G4B84_009764 [Aspergillus flavus NRRL3357]QRD93937.1 hypothetical protein F9C07_2246783 [Aspergillus flavus]RAQ71758.1 hypothetical protein COH20_011900 [Aspergillus flavus]